MPLVAMTTMKGLKIKAYFIRMVTIAGASMCAAAQAGGPTEPVLTADMSQEIIEIKVPPSEFARCVQTLDQVFHMSALGTGISDTTPQAAHQDATDIAPVQQVICVAQ